jgi:hypothetical protein
MANPEGQTRQIWSLVAVEAKLEDYAPLTGWGRQVGLCASEQAASVAAGVFAGFQSARRDAVPIEFPDRIAHDRSPFWSAVVGVLSEHRHVELDAERRVLRGYSGH